MKRRFIVIGMAALLLMALVPAVAFAAGRAFSASGDLVKTGSDAPLITAGADGYMPKPFRPSELLLKAEELLSQV